MDHLRLRALTLVETLADTGSLHQAARRMNVSQPALSVMLQEVERTLGGRLFERSRRGLLPTEMGDYMIHQSRLIMADLRRVQSEFAATADGRTSLRVGALPLVMLEIVPDALALIRRTMPGIQIEFHEGAALDMLTALADGSLDMVIGRMLPEFAGFADLEPSPLFDETLCIIGGAHHTLAGRRRVSWQQLQAADWIQSPPNTALRDYFFETFLRHGLKAPLPLYQSASFYSCIAILRSSDCLMMVPREVGRHFAREKSIRILKVEIGETPAPFSIIKRRSRAETQAVSILEKAIRQVLKSRRK